MPNPIVVLVAEDDFLVRMVAMDALIEAGFAVIDVEHADKALAILEGESADIHVLFTDIHMPPGKINGLELAHLVDAHWPWIVVIITSGELNLATEDMPSKCCFLPKPYLTEHMLQHVRNAAVIP